MLSNLKLVREIFIFVTDRTERVFLYRIRMTERSSWKKSSNLPRKTTNIKKKHERYVIRYNLCYTFKPLHSNNKDFYLLFW